MNTMNSELAASSVPSTTADVPLPAPRAGSARYPWATMEPGDSFFVAVASEDEDAGMVQRRVLSAARLWKERHGSAMFTTRRVVEEGVEGVRCWRIE